MENQDLSLTEASQNLPDFPGHEETCYPLTQ